MRLPIPGLAGFLTRNPHEVPVFQQEDDFTNGNIRNTEKIIMTHSNPDGSVIVVFSNQNGILFQREIKPNGETKRLTRITDL